MKALIYLILIILLSIVACNKESGVTTWNFDLGDTVAIKISQILVNDENKIQVQMDSVLNDSRCPIDVECIWAGNATVRFVLNSNSKKVRFNLNTTMQPRDTIISGYKIKLVSLLPFPVSTHPISYKEYYAKIVVEKI